MTEADLIMVARVLFSYSQIEHELQSEKLCTKSVTVEYSRYLQLQSRLIPSIEGSPTGQDLARALNQM